MTTKTKKDPEYGIIITPCASEEILMNCINELVFQNRDFCVSGTRNDWSVSYGSGPIFGVKK